MSEKPVANKAAEARRQTPPGPAVNSDFWGRVSRSRWGLVGLYLSAMLLPVLVLGFFIHSLMFTLLKARSTDVLLAKGQYAAAVLQQQLDDTAVAGSLCVASPEFVKTVRNGNQGAVTAQLDILLARLQPAGFRSVAIQGADGVVRFADSGAQELIGTPCDTRNIMRAPPATSSNHQDAKTAAASGLLPVPPPAGKEPRNLFVWSFDIQGPEATAGQLLLFPAADYLAKRLGSVSAEQDVECYVVDRQGLLLWHSGMAVTKRLDYSARPEVRQMLAGQQGVCEGRAPESGEATVSIHIPLPHLGIGVVASTARSAVYRGLEQMFLIFLVMLVVLTLLAIASALLAATVLAETRRKSCELADNNRALQAEIGERLKIEDALQKSREEFRALVQNTSDWFWEIDAQGVLTYTSPRLADLLAYWPEEVTGRKLTDFMAPEEKEQFDSLLAQLLTKKQPFASLDIVHRHKDGHRVILEASGTPVVDGFGSVVGFRGITRVPPRQ